MRLQPDETIRELPPAQLIAARSDTNIRRAIDALRELSLLEAELLFRVCCLSVRDGYCWASQEHLSHLVRHSERAVRTATGRLAELGLLIAVRSWEGLTYLPQWQRLDLAAPPPVDKPSDRKDLPVTDRKDLPVHYRSHSSGSHREDSSRAPRPAAAVRSDQEPERGGRPDEYSGELAQVAAKFGPDAELDCRDVVAKTSVRREAVLLAFSRLLALDRANIRSAGASFRNFVRLANEGRLASPARAAPITALSLLLRELERAKARGDSREVERLEIERFELALRLKREAASAA